MHKGSLFLRNKKRVIEIEILHVDTWNTVIGLRLMDLLHEHACSDIVHFVVYYIEDNYIYM